mgnify:CR=1 FL=1
MIILHGTYDKGKITIKEKKLPSIKGKVKIELIEEQPKKNITLGKYKLGGIYDNLNVRDSAYDKSSIEIPHYVRNDIFL